MKYLEATLLVLIGGMLLWVGLTVRKFVADLDSSIPVASSRLNATLSGVDKAVGQAQFTLEDLDEAATQQRDYYDPKKAGGPTQQIARLIVDAKSLIGRTDISLNGGPGIPGVLPQLGGTLNATSQLTQRVSTDFDATTLKADAILDGVSESTATVNRTLPIVMQNLKDSTDSGNKMLAQGVVIMTDARTGTDLALAREKELLKPLTFSQKVAQFLVGHLVDGTEMWYYLEH